MLTRKQTGRVIRICFASGDPDWESAVEEVERLADPEARIVEAEQTLSENLANETYVEEFGIEDYTLDEIETMGII